MSEQDSMSERELAEYLAESVYTDQPRSVGEALAAADTLENAQEPEPQEQEEPEGPPVVVEDVPTERDTGEGQEEPEVAATPEGEPEAEGEELDTEDDEHVVWAKKKYGDDTAKWARAAYEQEQHISRLAREKQEAENLAGEWYEYAQNIQQEVQQQSQMGMPLSASEEQWIENSLVNPYQAAQQAAMQGNFSLYNGVIARVAEENPMMAGQIDSQIRQELQQLAAQEQQQQNGAPQQKLAESIQRLGIDLQTYGDPMAAKIGELGEYHPYVQTILGGDPNARDIALMAVYDLVRSTAMSTRKVRSEERENQIKHEAELRRQAAGVVTGGPQAQEQPSQSPFLTAMEEEWKARGQWSDE
jgi:hypothetical protein